MDKRVSRPIKSETKALLLVACACAFLSVLATFDLSEHHRAWRTAKTWTEEQRRVASALDAGSLQPLLLAALVDNTLIVALSFACVLVLGIAVASDNRIGFYAAKIIIWTILILGITLILFIIVYKLKLESRILLKGPIYDYDLRLQPPLLLTLAGYPLVVLGFAFSHLQRSRQVKPPKSKTRPSR